MNATKPGGRVVRALLGSGQVMVSGGYDLVYYVTASAELYDPYSDTWSPTGGMHETRSDHTETQLGSGLTLVAGGSAYHRPPLGTAELYDPATGTWRLTGNLVQPRTRHRATLLDSGQVLLIRRRRPGAPRRRQLIRRNHERGAVRPGYRHLARHGLHVPGPRGS